MVEFSLKDIMGDTSKKLPNLQKAFLPYSQAQLQKIANAYPMQYESNPMTSTQGWPRQRKRDQRKLGTFDPGVAFTLSPPEYLPITRDYPSPELSTLAYIVVSSLQGIVDIQCVDNCVMTFPYDTLVYWVSWEEFSCLEARYLRTGRTVKHADAYLGSASTSMGSVADPAEEIKRSTWVPSPHNHEPRRLGKSN